MNKQQIKEKAIQLGKKVLLPIEFVLSFLFVYSLYRFLFINQIEARISAKHIILMTIFGILLIGVMIYHIKLKAKKIESIILTFLIPLGMCYFIFMIPSYGPDEIVHFRKAYELSEGIFVTSKVEKTKVPRDLTTKMRPHVNTYQELQEMLYTPTDYQDKIEVSNSANIYPFVPYIFSALGFLLARMLNFNIIIGCFLAQMFNFIAFLVAVYYAIKLIPFGKLMIAAVCFMPMFLQQAISGSSDCMLNCISMVFIAFCLHLVVKKEKVTKKEGITLVVLSALIALNKYAYLPIVGLSLLLLFTKNMTKKQKAIIVSTALIASIVIAVGYYIFSSTYPSGHGKYVEENQVNASEQIKEIIHHPGNYVKTLFTTFGQQGENYIYQAIGSSLSWFCIPVPFISIIAYLFVMIGACFVEKHEIALSRNQKLYCLAICLGVIVLVATGMYLTWTTVGKPIIEGIQGRYFIPIIFLLGLCLCQKDNYLKIKNSEIKLPLLFCLLNLPALCAIYEFFS